MVGTGHRGLPQTYRVYSTQFPVSQNPSFRTQRLGQSINKGKKQFTAIKILNKIESIPIKNNDPFKNLRGLLVFNVSITSQYVHITDWDFVQFFT